MSMAEVFLSIVPVIWLVLAGLVFKDEPFDKFVYRWIVMVAVCLMLSFIMLHRLSSMMGGRGSWGEGFYYGWLLVAFFSFLQIVKKVIWVMLNKIFRLKTVILKIFYFGIIFIVMVPFFLAMTSVHRIKVGDALNPKTAIGLDYEDVSWKAADGLNIKAWFVPARSDRAVLIAHGLGANKSNFIGTVQLWHELGFNVLIFDFRGHGESDGHTVTFGYHERLDVIGGWNYLTRDRKFAIDNIVGYGVSFGGAAMIYAAQERCGFSKLIIDSSFASLDDMASRIVEGEPIIPAFLRSAFKEIGLFFIRMDVGYDIRDKSPEKVVGQLAGIPVLFIHGKGDPLIPWAQSERLYARAGEPKQLCLMGSLGHFGTFNDPGYSEIIAAFIQSDGLGNRKARQQESCL